MSNIVHTKNAKQSLTLCIEGLDEIYETSYYIGESLLAKYAMAVKFVRHLKNQFVVEINRMEEVIAETAAIQNHAFDLASACGKILFPIEIVLDEDANITAINNHKEIINRWLKQAPALIAYYSGYVAHAYLAQTEQNLLNANAFIRSLRKDFFISAFFIPLNLNVRDGQTINTRRTFYIPDASVTNIAQTATRIESNSNHFQVGLSGKPLPDAPVSLEIEGRYVLERVPYKIHSVDFLWKIKDAEKSYEISISIRSKK